MRRLAWAAIDLGINLLDTADVNETEEMVGAAVKVYDRDKLATSTKTLFKTDDMAEMLTQREKASLKRTAIALIDGQISRAMGPQYCRYGGALRAKHSAAAAHSSVQL